MLECWLGVGVKGMGADSNSSTAEARLFWESGVVAGVSKSCSAVLGVATAKGTGVTGVVGIGALVVECVGSCCAVVASLAWLDGIEAGVLGSAGYGAAVAPPRDCGCVC